MLDEQPDDGPHPSPAGLSLDPDQQERWRKLDAQSPSLARIYEWAVLLLETCDRRADMALLGHCVREILNRLPDVLGQSIAGSQGETNKAIAALMEAWDEEMPADGETDDPSDAKELESPVATIPATVLKAVRQIVHHHRAGAGANNRQSEFLATGAVSNGGPASVNAPALLH